MAKRVVDLLEVVEIEAKHGELLALAKPGDRRIHVVPKQHAVWQAGQRVVVRHEADPLLIPALLGHIVEGDDGAAIGHRLARDPQQAGRGAPPSRPVSTAEWSTAR